MTTRRWPWLASAGLLMAAGLAAGWSTFLHWLPCRGAMLNGSIVYGYTYPREFSEACLRRMDGGIPFPYPPEPGEQTAWASELGVAATVLVGLAWLTLVAGSTLIARTRAVAALPGLLTLGLAGLAARAVGQADRSLDSSATLALWMLVEGLTVLALIVIWLDLRPMDSWTVGAMLVVAWGSTAFGGFRQMFDYVSMAMVSDANWDVPPGMGFPTALALLLSGALTFIYATRRSGPARGREPAGLTLVDRPA